MSLISMKSIPCGVRVLDQDNTEVIFTVPNDMVRPMKLFMESFMELFAGVAWKVKTDEKLIHIRNEENSKKAVSEFDKYSSYVISTYQQNILLSMTPDESFKQTCRQAKVIYP